MKVFKFIVLVCAFALYLRILFSIAAFCLRFRVIKYKYQRQFEKAIKELKLPEDFRKDIVEKYATALSAQMVQFQKMKRLLLTYGEKS